MIKDYAIRRYLKSHEFSWIVRSGTGEIFALVPDAEQLPLKYPNVFIYNGGMDPIMRVCNNFISGETAIYWLTFYEDFFVNVIGDDALTDIQLAICGDDAAAWRVANVFTPTAKYWIDDIDRGHKSFEISVWNGEYIVRNTFLCNEWKKTAALVKMVFSVYVNDMEEAP